MKLKLSLMLALLVLCSASAFAVAPFSMTVEAGATPNSWVYTLTNNDTTGDVIPTYLDILWDPAVPTSYYTVTAAPAGWVINPSFDWPAFDAIGNDPGPEQSLSGFELTADTYAPFFTAYYNVMSDEFTFDGAVTPVPEPGSLLALLGGVASLGAMIRRRIA